MPRGKVYATCEAALADISSGDTVLIGGFATCGVPRGLIGALCQKAVKDLTCVYSPGAWPNSAGSSGIDQLVANGQLKKLISALPFGPTADWGIIKNAWQTGQLEIEVLPQGTLAERLRAAGAGLGGVFLATGVGTRFAEGKEVRAFAQRECILELPLKADFALFKADTADTLGNVVYRGSGRNWGPVMAMAATVSIAEADRVCDPGGIDPEAVISSGIFVNRVVQGPDC
ncbi:MAG TPA: 3-oxoacid CoA-transferase subunit A [Dehalococcoidia bacterium]|nr:3-oxoacid CoA-transferase subunit A [Dehalococcoidia bacterium]